MWDLYLEAALEELLQHASGDRRAYAFAALTLMLSCVPDGRSAIDHDVGSDRRGNARPKHAHGGLGTGARRSDASRSAVAFFRWLLRHHARDLVAMEARVAAASREYTFVRPPRLIDTPNDAYVVQDGSLPTSSSSASFRAVANFIVDAVEVRTHVGQVVGLVGAWQCVVSCLAPSSMTAASPPWRFLSSRSFRVALSVRSEFDAGIAVLASHRAITRSRAVGCFRRSELKPSGAREIVVLTRRTVAASETMGSLRRAPRSGGRQNFWTRR